jgi:hypothetical protein
MQMEKWYLLNLIQEWERENKGEWWNGGESEFKYDILARTFINAILYLHPEQFKKKEKKKKTKCLSRGKLINKCVNFKYVLFTTCKVDLLKVIV